MSDKKLEYLKQLFSQNIKDITLIMSAEFGEFEAGLDEESIDLITQLVLDYDQAPK
jgi:hypothetical protein